jgi:outer membrane protein OmpA-like peptidoglycan-associated protein
MIRNGFQGIIRIMTFILIVLVTEVSSAWGQGRIDRLAVSATEAYRSGDSGKAFTLAARVLETNSSNLDMLLLMAEIYRDRRDEVNELLYLEKASAVNGYPPLLSFRLGESYFRAGRYQEAYDWIKMYLAGNPAPALVARAGRIMESAGFARKAILNPSGFEPVSLGDSVNTAYDEYWPSLTVDGSTLVFTRLLPVEGRTDLWQEDFFISSLAGDGWSEAVPLSVNSHLNEGAQSISADGTLLFFTLCNHPEGLGSCDIWFSRFLNGIWTSPRNAGRPLNTASWEGQPSLSAFGDVLYFSSNRPGGRGNKDIWMAELKGWRPDGLPLWGDPVNLGDSINTPGDEISPFIHPNGRELFFSSDYWPGFGGFDLFRTTIKTDGTMTRAENLGYPLNTKENEQGLVIDRTGTVAYLASNREPERGMDIYTFELDASLRTDPVTYIRGVVKNGKTGEPVQASVHLTGINEGNSVDFRISADAKGIFTVTLPVGQEFAFHVNEPGFLFYSEYFMVEEAAGTPGPVYREILLTPVEIGSQAHLYNVFFGTGSHELLEQSETELNTLAGFLKRNSSLEVEIQGHTDNVGSESYNQGLSERRAGSVVEYLVSKGIDPGRLTSKGYGLTVPLDTNETEEGRARNRRTTLLITGVLPHLPE